MKDMLFYQILAYTIHGKIFKKLYKKTINLKYQLQQGMENLNYLMCHILYQIFKTILNTSKNNEEKIDNPSITVFFNKIENRITFKI